MVVQDDVLVKKNDKEILVRKYNIYPLWNWKDSQVKISKDSTMVKFKPDEVTYAIIYNATHSGHYITYYDVNKRKQERLEDIPCSLIHQCQDHCINKKVKIVKKYYPTEDYEIILIKENKTK